MQDVSSYNCIRASICVTAFTKRLCPPGTQFSFPRDVHLSRRRSRRLASAATAAPSPNTPPPARLLDLPRELLERVLSRFDSPIDIAHVAAVSHLFHASLAEQGIRLWARDYNPSLLGHGEDVTRLNKPTRLPSPLGGERAVSVSAGHYHSLALTAHGSAWSWGEGGFGRLGHGDEQSQLLPETVEALAGQRVVAASAGTHHSLAIAADGSVWSWGDGNSGRLGHGDAQNQLLPKKVEAFAGQRVVAVSAGGRHSLAITADGAVWSWGCGWNGRLAHGDTQSQLLPKKVEALGGQRVVAVSSGAHHSLALTADGAVWSWGWGEDGRLGHGDQQLQLQLQLLPKKVEALAGQRVAAVSAGGFHSLATTADGAVFTWGNGGTGCLGHGEDLSNQLLPKVEEWASGQ